MTLLFYDFETFKYDWLVVIINAETHEETVIVNDREKFLSFYNEHKESIWVGYNSSGYDQFIARAIICDFDPKKVNDWIIVKHMSGWQFSSLFYDVPFYTYDVMTSPHSLKQLEAFMGNDIRETSVSFDIDRKLTKDEIRETIEYCRHDVEQTAEVFIRRYPEYESKMGLIKTFKLPLDSISRSVPQMIALILGAKRRVYGDEFDVAIPSTLRLQKYAHVAEWYRNAKADTIREMTQLGLNPNDYESFRKHFYSRTLTVNVAGVEHGFAWGGVHGAIEKYCVIGSAIISLTAATLVHTFPNVIASLYVDKGLPELLEATTHALSIFSLAFVTRWISFVTQSFMLAIEKPKYAAAISISTALVFPMLLLLVLKNFGLEGIWFNFAGTNLLAAILAIAILAKEWKNLMKADD